MAKKCICFILLVVFISIAESKTCYFKTESGEINKVCCADYEENGNDCIACSKGYTSDIGQQCKPCSKNTFGERCRYECSCLGPEICDNVEGCVEFATTTDTSVYETSSTSMQRSKGKRCESKTESGETIKVCCTDYEEKGNECIPCSTGYTSKLGQNCTSCPKNTYGERCKSDCSCSGFEICDNIKGCFGFPSTTETSVYATSYDITYKFTKETGTYSGSDIMTLTWDLDVTTNVGKSDNSIEDVLSREIIAYYTLTLMVLVPVICLCHIFYKYKIVAKKKKATFVIPPNPSRNSQNIEIEESLYDNIDNIDMIGFIEQMEMSPYHIDVLGGSNSSGSGENTSSFDERNKDYLKKPVIKISPPNIKYYTTQATVHRIERSEPDNKRCTPCEHEYKLQQINEPKKYVLRLQYEYDIASINGRFTVPKRCLSNITKRVSQSCNNLNIECIKSNVYTGETIHSTDDNMLDFHDMCKARSESNIV